MFGADGDEVFVRMPVGIHIVAVIRADVAQFSFGVAKNPSHGRSQACRTGGHALGAWNTACSMIPRNGVCRVRRRRFAEVRSADATKGGSTRGSAGEGVSIIRLVSIAIFSVSFSMLSTRAAKGVSCSKHGSSMPATTSRRSLLVDVELVLWVVISVSVATSSETESESTISTASVTALCS